MGRTGREPLVDLRPALLPGWIWDNKKWMKLDLSSAAKVQGGSPPVDGGPQEGLKVLEGVRGVEEVGTEDIDGVHTTHYRGTFPITEEVFGVKVHYSAPHADVWIDSQDRVRRMHVAVTGSLNGDQASTATTEMTIDYVDFGRVPKIEVPPADEVFNVTGEIEAKAQAAAEGN